MHHFGSFSEPDTITKGCESPCKVHLVADCESLAPYGKRHGSTAEASGGSAANVKVCWSRRETKLHIRLYTQLLRVKKASTKRKRETMVASTGLKPSLHLLVGDQILSGPALYCQT